MVLRVRQLLITILLTLAVVGGIKYLSVDWQVQAQNASSPCDQTIAVSDASGQSQTLVSAVAGAAVYVCAYDISADTASTTLTWKSGTTALSGAELSIANGHYTAGTGTGILLQTSSGAALVVTSASGALAGWVKVGQH